HSAVERWAGPPLPTLQSHLVCDMVGAPHLQSPELSVLYGSRSAVVSRPPFLPKHEKKSSKMAFPNLSERRLWALVLSSALPAIAPGPILTLLALYLSQGLGVSQASLQTPLLIPPWAWGIGYFFWRWIADRYAQDNRRPAGLFLLLTVCALVL